MADTNMRIWDAVSRTDPTHTKKVEFGRKFTSIDAHWQIMQATKQFGPIGEGWGYRVDHSVLTLTPEMILAVADVVVWWNKDAGDEYRSSYGPIRATCEMYGPKTKFGKIIPGEFVTDEDAPKKAMTDALTKGLSHLGFSADVFLGLFDDNRYVQKMEREFKDGPAGAATRALAETRAEIEEETGNTQTQYQADKLKKAITARWEATNKTDKGKEDQIFDYLDIARNEADVSAILNKNVAFIEVNPKKDDINAAATRLLDYFQSEVGKAHAT